MKNKPTQSEQPKTIASKSTDKSTDREALKVRRKHVEKRIDEVNEESFPASDPPQWNSISKENEGKIK